MRLRDCVSTGRLRPHETSEKEILDILHVIRRDLSDAIIKWVSPDSRVVYIPSLSAFR